MFPVQMDMHIIFLFCIQVLKPSLILRNCAFEGKNSVAVTFHFCIPLQTPLPEDI